MPGKTVCDIIRMGFFSPFLVVRKRHPAEQVEFAILDLMARFAAKTNGHPPTSTACAI